MEIAITYPKNNEPLYCFLFCGYGVSDAVVNGEKCLIVHYNTGLPKIKQICEKFGLHTFSAVKPDYTNSRIINDRLEKHSPRNIFGMLCENTYNKYFKNN